MIGKVYLVGAGPGDPELLTVKAARLLATADVVLHDDLVPEAVLAMIHQHALVTSVGKRCGRPRVTQAMIHTMMIDAAKRGLNVVRLKSGDPMVFGRAAEELAALRDAGVPVEVVPGVSAAFAAAAALQVPMTDRRTASRLILATGSHAEGKDAPPLWSGALPENATLAIYMPGRDFAATGANLLAHGMPADMPCVAVSRAGTADQSVSGCRVGGMAELKAGPAPLLLLIGRALEPMLLGEQADEFEPLLAEAAELQAE